MGENAGLQAENITVNAICPSFVPTGLAPPEMLKCIFIPGASIVLTFSDGRKIPSLHHPCIDHCQGI